MSPDATVRLPHFLAGARARLPEQPPRPPVPVPRPVAAMLSSDLFWNYTLYVDLLDWDDAEAVCERARGALAWFDGPRDWRRLAALVLSLWKQRWPTDPRHCPHCGCVGDACWFQAIGYYGTRPSTGTPARQATWRSVAGGDSTWLPPWGPNQPDFCGSDGETRSCTQMWIEGLEKDRPLDTMPITLSDAPCSCKLPFVCKVPGARGH